MRFQKYFNQIFARGSHVKIIRVLVSSPGKEWSERELATAAGIDHKVVSHMMPLLVSYKLVSKQQIAKANVYRLNGKHYIVKQLRRLFENERKTPEYLKQRLTRACARNKHILSATLFGSVARGTEEPDSDIDLLILTDGHTNLKGLFEGVEVEFGHVVAPHLWTFDQLQTKKRSTIFRKILQEGQHIYGRRLEELVR